MTSSPRDTFKQGPSCNRIASLIGTHIYLNECLISKATVVDTHSVHKSITMREFDNLSFVISYSEFLTF